MSVEGMKDLGRKLDKMSRADIEKCVARGIQTVRGAAVAGCPVNDGELRQSIFIDVLEENGTVFGVCYTNKKYAPFVEFGTGPKGQEKHDGISPEYNPTYTQSPWWIHESQVDKRIAEQYHWFYIDTEDGRFYQCTGQAAQPFMYPALRDNREEILSDFKADLYADLRRGIR